MATLTSFRRLAGLIHDVRSIEELTQVIREMPDCLLSYDVGRAVLAELPRLIQLQTEKKFNLEFMQEIVDAMARYHRDPDSNHMIPSRVEVPALSILYDYVYGITECSDARNPIPTSVFDDTKHTEQRPARAAALVGIIFLLIKYRRWSVIDQKLWNIVRDADILEAFFITLADVTMPMTDAHLAASICSSIVQNYAKEAASGEDHLDVCAGTNRLYGESTRSFPDIVQSGRIAELAEKIASQYLIEDIYDIEDQANIRAEALELFSHFINIVDNDFGRELITADYCAMISRFYTLSDVREQICTRYEPYFKVDTPLYMADIYRASIREASTLKEYGTMEDARAYEILHIEIERIIYDIFLNHPDVDPTIIKDFFRDIFHSHSYFVRGFTEGACLASDAITNALAKEKEEKQMDYPAVEALLIRAEAMSMAMEDDFSDLTGESDDGDYRSPSTSKRFSANDERVSGNGSLEKPSDKKRMVYKEYKSREKSINDTLDSATSMVKRMFQTGARTMLINKKKMTIFGLLRRCIVGYYVFSYGRFKGLLALATAYYLKNRVLRSEKIKFIRELEEELMMVDEKIKDAEANGDREAKYALMRSREAIKNNLQRMRYGVGVKESSQRTNTQIGQYRG